VRVSDHRLSDFRSARQQLEYTGRQPSLLEKRRFGVFRGSGLALIRWSAAGSVLCETPSCTAICWDW